MLQDLIWLSKEDTLIPRDKMVEKGEPRFCGDVLIYPKDVRRTVGRTYEEERDYYSGKEVTIIYECNQRIYKLTLYSLNVIKQHSFFGRKEQA